MTFIAATNLLQQVGLAYESYAAAFLAVMESPAIIVGVLLGRLGGPAGAGPGGGLRHTLREAVCGRSVILLLGALAAGFLSGERGLRATEAFFVAPFQGVLALFLLEMGMVAARRFGDLRQVGPSCWASASSCRWSTASWGGAVGHATGLSTGGTMLFATLAAGASYIAAPAAMRLSLPEANPTLYLTASLAVTFPFNLTPGLPLHLALARGLAGEAPAP